MSADSPRRHHSHHHSSGIGVGGGPRGSSSSGVGGSGGMAMPAIVPPQTVSDRSILDSAIGFINDVTLVHQPLQDPKDTITWARFETSADVSDPRFGDDWELEGNAAPPLLLILGYGLGVQVWAIPANGEAVEVLSWRHGVVTALRVLPTPATAPSALDDNGRADEPVDAFAEKRPLVALVDGGSAAASNLLSGGSMGGGGGGSGHMSGGSGSAGGGMGNHSGVSSHFSAVNFVSLKTGTQVKTIKFKNAVLDIQANRSAVVISFHERLAVFDARTLEDRLTITTCFPSPGINPNPIALGPRWLAYAEHKLLHSKRSGGGCDGEGVPSYTATVLNAAKSFGKGLRELGEQVAAGLTGTTAGSGNSSKSSSFDSATGGADAKQSGVVTIIDVKHPIKDYSPTSGTPLGVTSAQTGGDPIVAHFVAHSEALVALEFDSSGMLLLTADRRGHDFHVFRIQPHPVGSSLAAVHHLYVLHRGDTSAKVQHIAFSLDSRWAAVSTLRGTTHVFPITPYGGAMGVRTHTSLHVVNKLSRFHRSAGLGADGRSSSPISHSESTTFVQSLQPYHNPTLPPFPRPAVVQPLAQLRQPFTLGSPPGSAAAAVGSSLGGVGVGSGVSSHQRQRLSSLSDDSGKPLSVCATFAKSRSWLLEPPTATREAPHRVQRKAVDSLFVMAGHGALIQYDLDTKLASNVAKEKICDDTPIELEVEAKAQWNLGRRKDGSQEIIPPLALDNWLIKDRHASLLMDSANQFDEPDERAESWLAQVEIITHAGPHRRLWMGPQFVFKNYNTPSGSNLNHVDAEAVEIGVTKTTTTTLPSTAAAASASSLTPSGAIVAAVERSSPLNMPLGAAVGPVAAVTSTGRAGVPVLIESGSYSSIEQSPKLMDRFRHGHLDSDYGHGDMRLKEDLADAMRESPSTAAARRETGVAQRAADVATAAATAAAVATVAAATTATATTATATTAACDNACYYDALAEHDADEEEPQHEHSNNNAPSAAAKAALASVLPNICSYELTTGAATGAAAATKTAAAATQTAAAASPRVEKIVNPLGTVTDVHAGISGELQTDMLDEVVGQLAAEDCVIHENCDEALFRPVVAIFCDELAEQRRHELQLQQQQLQQQQLPHKQAHNQPPVVLANKLIVPVIAKEVDEVITLKERQQKSLKSQAAAEDAAQALRFAELSHLNKPTKGANNNNSNNSNNSNNKVTTTAKTASQHVKPTTASAAAATTTATTAIIATATTTTTTTATTSEDEQPEEELLSSISSSLSLKTSQTNKRSKAIKHKTNKVAANAQQQQLKSNKKDKKQAEQEEAERKQKEKEKEKEQEEEEEAKAKAKAKVKAKEAEQEEQRKQKLKEEEEEQKAKAKAEAEEKARQQLEPEWDQDDDWEEQAEQEQEREQEKWEQEQEELKREKELKEKRELKQKQELKEKRELKEKQELKLKREQDKRRQQQETERETEQQQKKTQLKHRSTAELKELELELELEPEPEPEPEFESEPDYADKLLAKRDVIAATMVSSASAQGLNLHVQTESGKSPKSKTSCQKAKEQPQASISSYQVKVLDSMPTSSSSSVAWKTPAATTTTTTSSSTDFPSLSGRKTCEKLLPGLLAPLSQDSRPRRDPHSFDEFMLGSLLPPLDALPPLPALEPLNVPDDSSLINFESPLQENAARKITPPPRGFTEQNLILALCGSLHYETEYAQLLAKQTSPPPPPLPLPPLAPVVDVMHKSTGSSNNSSGSEEQLLLMEPEPKKLSKKHKRAKQQQQQQAVGDDEELRPLISISMCDSQLDKQQLSTDEELQMDSKQPIEDDDDDDEGDDRDEDEAEHGNRDRNWKRERDGDGDGNVAVVRNQTLPGDLLHFGSSATAPHSGTTTDSEGPVPATTSDDNIIYGHNTVASHAKLKTKKLEHKINLIAAIEAATSSSTSSAEESSAETAATATTTTTAAAAAAAATANSAAAAFAEASLNAAANFASGSNSHSNSGSHNNNCGGNSNNAGLGVAVGVPVQPSAAKKKTKRRKR